MMLGVHPMWMSIKTASGQFFNLASSTFGSGVISGGAISPSSTLLAGSISGSPHAAISTNNTTYSSSTTPGSSALLRAEYGSSLFVVANSAGVTYTSSTGESFSEGGSIGFGVYSLSYGNSEFIAGSNLGYIYRSTNAGSWTSYSTGSSGIIRSAKYLNGLYIVGNSSGGVLRSSGGSTFTSSTTPFSASSLVIDVDYGLGRYMAVTNANEIAQSSDGSTFTSVTTPSGIGSISGVVNCGDRFIVYGGQSSSGRYAESFDGLTFGPVKSDLPEMILGMKYGRGLLLAFGQNGMAAYAVMG